MIQFNPPPGWPPVPDGWMPPDGWQPDPSWPPAPPGWTFYVDPAAGRRRPSTKVIALATAAALFVVLTTYVVVSSLTGHRSFEITVNDFAYNVEITDTDRVTAVTGLLAKPGYSFIAMTVEVTNLQTDRAAPLINSVQAIAAPPEVIRVGPPSAYGGAQSCDVPGSAAGEVSTGIAGAPTGWCFFSVVHDETEPSGTGPLEAGATVSQTYHSSSAFPSDVDAGLFHVYGQTDGSETVRGQDLDLGEAG